MEYITKEKIIAEYLAGGTTYRKLQAKYGYNFRSINYWVLSYLGRKKSVTGKNKPQIASDKGYLLPRDAKQLEVELRRIRLHNQLLNEIIDIAEEKLEVDIRKKYGTKQS